MEKEEALKDFNERYVNKKSHEKILELQKYYEKHKEELSLDFIKSLKKVCIKANEMQSKNVKEKIENITYSMLRTKMLQKKYVYLIEFFDKSFFLDEKECHGEYHASWAFKFLEELEEDLQKERKKYAGKISISDVQRIILKEAVKYNKYIEDLGRYAVANMNSDEFDIMKKEEEIVILIGEYRDLYETVYKSYSKEKDSHKVREWIKEKLENEYAYEEYKNLDLSYLDCSDLNFQCSRFIKTNLEKSKMKECVFVRTSFKECNLKEVDFRSSMLHGADFRNCDLTNANFYNTYALHYLPNEEDSTLPKIAGINFEGANLTNANFEQVDFQDASFKGANLENATFLKEDKGKFHLDEEQISAINWK